MRHIISVPEAVQVFLIFQASLFRHQQAARTASLPSEQLQMWLYLNVSQLSQGRCLNCNIKAGAPHPCMMSTIPSPQQYGWLSPTNRLQSLKKRLCHWCFLIYFMSWASELYSFCSSSHQLPTRNKTAVSICITCPLTSAHMLTWWNEEQFRYFKAISLLFLTTKKQSKCSHPDRLNTASIKMQIRGCLQLESALQATAVVIY